MILALASSRAASVTVKKPKVDPFCIAPAKREELKAKLKEKIFRTDCAAALRKLRLARLDCSDAQSIRDFKSAVLGTIRPDDDVAEGFARAVCPGKADAACMNLEPQCRLRPFPGDPGIPGGTGASGVEKLKEAKKKFFRDRLPDISEGQAQTLVNHYMELHGQY